LGPIHHCSHFFRIHLNILYRDDVSQRSDCGEEKLALLCFNKQLVLQKELKNVFLGRMGENQDVIELYKNKPIQHVPEHIVNQSLEDSKSLVSPNGMIRYS
jgi:hypothetical protein